MAKAISSFFFCHIFKCFFIISSCYNRIIETDIFTFMFIYSHIYKTSIFITLKLVNGIVHQCTIEYSQTYKKFKVFNSKPSNFFEKARFQLGYDVTQTSFSIIS